MMKALQDKAMDGFKRQFQQVDALLIDDIQFFAGKDRTQEEFFHTFNALFDGKQQIIMTCDRFPREVEGLEPRLKSRLASGLSVPRSEEHTSELQSLMRISYAVFCLKK